MFHPRWWSSLSALLEQLPQMLLNKVNSTSYLPLSTKTSNKTITIKCYHVNRKNWPIAKIEPQIRSCWRHRSAQPRLIREAKSGHDQMNLTEVLIQVIQPRGRFQQQKQTRYKAQCTNAHFYFNTFIRSHSQILSILPSILLYQLLMDWYHQVALLILSFFQVIQQLSIKWCCGENFSSQLLQQLLDLRFILQCSQIQLQYYLLQTLYQGSMMMSSIRDQPSLLSLPMSTSSSPTSSSSKDKILWLHNTSQKSSFRNQNVREESLWRHQVILTARRSVRLQ